MLTRWRLGAGGGGGAFGASSAFGAGGGVVVCAHDGRAIAARRAAIVTMDRIFILTGSLRFLRFRAIALNDLFRGETNDRNITLEHLARRLSIEFVDRDLAEIRPARVLHSC